MFAWLLDPPLPPGLARGAGAGPRPRPGHRRPPGRGRVRRPATEPRRSPAIARGSRHVMSDWGYVAMALGHHRRRCSSPTPSGSSSAAARCRGACRPRTADGCDPRRRRARPRRPTAGDRRPRPQPPHLGAGGHRPRRTRRWGPIVVLVLVLGGVGFVAAQALTTATTFFYNADEAVAQAARARHQPLPHAGHRRARHDPADRRRGRLHRRPSTAPRCAVVPRRRPARAVQGRRAGRARGPLGQRRRSLPERPHPGQARRQLRRPRTPTGSRRRTRAARCRPRPRLRWRREPRPRHGRGRPRPGRLALRGGHPGRRPASGAGPTCVRLGAGLRLARPVRRACWRSSPCSGR